MKKYLTVGVPSKGMSCYGMMSDARGTIQKWVASRIRRMDYNVFVQTIYWRLIAWQVKCNNGWRCSITGKLGNLEVHHWNYNTIHGFEMFHIGELECVCHEEHVRIHQEMEEALERYHSC